jgi:hypothetical protein
LTTVAWLEHPDSFMGTYGRRHLSGLLLAASLLHAGSVEDYLAAFERESQRLATSSSEFTSRNRQTGPAVRTHQIAGIDRPGDIYHIRGSVFLPGARLESVAAVARDYGKHSEIFGPRIAASAVCAEPAADTYVYRYWTDSYRDSVSETRAVHRTHAAHRFSVVSMLTGIGATGDVAGRSRLCTGELRGAFYMKDLRATWRYEQVDGGVWVESDMVAVLSGFSLVRSIARRSLKELVEDGLKGWKRRFSGSR